VFTKSTDDNNNYRIKLLPADPDYRAYDECRPEIIMIFVAS